MLIKKLFPGILKSRMLKKLRKAGSDEVISPNSIGGLRIASTMIHPTVVQFLDAMLKDTSTAIRFEEIRISELKSIVGLSVKEADIANKTGLIELTVMHDNGSCEFNPGDEIRYKEGDTLLVMSSRDQIGRLKKI